MGLGSSGDDTLVASAIGDILIGRGGNDLLQSDLGDTTLHGNAGDDTLATLLPLGSDPHFEASQSSEQDGGSGNDHLSVIGNINNYFLFSTQSGGSGADTIIGEAENVTCLGGSGNDMITQKAAAGMERFASALIDGGLGSDTIDATIYGTDVGAGDAHISGGGGADKITLTGYAESSDITILGGRGADTISASMSSRDSGSVDIIVDGGGGADVLDVYANGTSIGSATVHLMGGGGNDHIQTNPTANGVYVTLEGGAGDDTLMCTPRTQWDGGRVNAVFHGDGGNDHLIGSIRPGDIAVDSGEWYLIYNQTFHGGTGHDLIEATIGRHLPEASDPGTSFSANNTAFGGAGNDTILISGGLDNLIDGGRGNDLLQGSDNADQIMGGTGSDTLEGQSGDDTLSGGAGSDTFVFSSSDLGTSTIIDWNRTQDWLDLDLTDLNGNGLLDELKGTASYALNGTDGYLTLGPQNVIVFKDASTLWGNTLEDLFVDPDTQII